jgi:imidazolonepropionase
MSKRSLLITDIARLVTMDPQDGREGPLGAIAEAAVRVCDGRIAWVGRQAELPAVRSREDIIDARGGIVLPGLVDCHTHLVHSGSRQQEFNLRSQGKSYQEIAAAGGGIMSTVRATREASEDDLFESARGRALEALAHGITTIEVKTGYGLDVESEAKIARVIARLRSVVPQTIVGTQLGAHVVPPEYRDRREDYVRLVIEEMLPEAAVNGAFSACDIFVEEGAFTHDEARAIAAAGKALGLSLHLHVDQFADGGGAALAAELGALSADHLDHANDEGIRAMAVKGVVGVLLPGASLFAGRGRFPNARRMIDQGLRVALSTDYNPGTSPTLDLWLMATIAVTQMGCTCDEALLGITRNAATALGLVDRGSISVGKRADLIVLVAPDEYFPLYRCGARLVRQVIAGGSLVKERE